MVVPIPSYAQGRNERHPLGQNSRSYLSVGEEMSLRIKDIEVKAGGYWSG
jgi:hypothetical protein